VLEHLYNPTVGAVVEFDFITKHSKTMQRIAKPYVNFTKLMRVSLLVLTVNLTFLSLCFARKADGQELLDRRISLQLTNVTVPEVLAAIEKNSGVHFVYRSNLFSNEAKISVVSKQERLKAVLDRVLSPKAIRYQISNENFIILSKDVKTASLEEAEKKIDFRVKHFPDTTILIQGRVLSKGVPVPGASVMIEGTSFGATTDENGSFSLGRIRNGSYTLLISHVSYAKLKEKIIANGQNMSLSIEMPEDPLQLQQIVVTSTGSPKKKIESSVAITTVSAKVLEDRAPLNSAEAIKAIPGIMVNSSGGDGPGNAFVRGIPSGGGYAFFGVMEDGLPVLPTGFNSYPSPDQNFKVDLTIKSIEGIRGGNAPLMMVNTAGALMNNISYTGAEKTYGKFKATTGLSQEMFRLDGNVGGSISKKVKYNVGGFYRTDKGIRPPTFTANQGGQLKANMTWNFNNKGFIRVYTKYINDKVQWQLPGIYAYNTEKRVEPFQGFDMYKQTLVPSETQFNLKMPEGYVHNTDLSEGYRTKLGSGGLQFNYNVNGWNIRNNFRYQYNDIRATYPTVTAFVAFASNRRYYYTNGQELMNPTGFYATQQNMDGRRLESQIIDYLDLTKRIGKHSVTIGGGVYSYNVISNETINSVINTEIASKPRILLVNSATASPATPASNTTPQGHVKNDGVTNMYSVYAMDEFAVTDRLRLEAGIRIDRFDLNGTKGVYGGSSTAAGGTGFKIIGMTPWSADKNYWSASVAANYKVNNSLAFFVRGTRSYNAFNYSDYTALDYDPARLKDREILMAEVGTKYAQGRFSLFSSLGYTSTKNLPQSVTYPIATGALFTQSLFSSSRAFGWETEATFQATKRLNLRLTATLQDSKFTDYPFVVSANGRPDIAGLTLNWKGNMPQNTPVGNIQLGGTYDYKTISLFGTAIHQTYMWSTSANTYKIPAFTDVIAGVSAKLFKKTTELRLWSNNLLNTRALTAGNVRGEQFIQEKNLVVGQPMIGRPTTPRSIFFSVAYGF
jgi:iron complex outermembrane recepter protein